MSARPNLTDSVALLGLLRRFSCLPPADADRIFATSLRGAPPEIQRCVHEYGRAGSLVKLAAVYPRGYVERQQSGQTEQSDDDYPAIAKLVGTLDAQLPHPENSRNSIYQARLDDLIARDVLDSVKAERRAAQLKRLGVLYELPPRLSRLDEFASSLKGHIDLSNTLLIGHQHLLGSVATQFEALWKLGLRPERTYVVGKAYSTNRLVAEYLRMRGCYVEDGISGFGRSSVLSPSYYQNATDEALGGLLLRVATAASSERVDQLLVLDDGGLVLNWLDRIVEKDLIPPSRVRRLARLRVAGVEQTTFGRRLLQVAERRKPPAPGERVVPVANVAESRLKIEVEAELIGESIVSELEAWLKISHAPGHVRALRDAKVGVAGFGAVGSWVCRTLQRRRVHHLCVFDIEASRSSIARSYGYDVCHSPRELAAQSNVIIGCSGAGEGVHLVTSMLQPDTVLASGSSGNHEFAPAFMSASSPPVRLNPDATPARSASGFDWIHAIYPVDVPGGKAYILNGGFPINFTGAIDPIRPDEIELTRCLMLAGVASAIEARGDVRNFGGPVQFVDVDQSALMRLFIN